MKNNLFKTLLSLLAALLIFSCPNPSGGSDDNSTDPASGGGSTGLTEDEQLSNAIDDVKTALALNETTFTATLINKLTAQTIARIECNGTSGSGNTIMGVKKGTFAPDSQIPFTLPNGTYKMSAYSDAEGLNHLITIEITINNANKIINIEGQGVAEPKKGSFTVTITNTNNLKIDKYAVCRAGGKPVIFLNPVGDGESITLPLDNGKYIFLAIDNNNPTVYSAGMNIVVAGSNQDITAEKKKNIDPTKCVITIVNQTSVSADKLMYMSAFAPVNKYVDAALASPLNNGQSGEVIVKKDTYSFELFAATAFGLRRISMKEVNADSDKTVTLTSDDRLTGLNTITLHNKTGKAIKLVRFKKIGGVPQVMIFDPPKAVDSTITCDVPPGDYLFDAYDSIDQNMGSLVGDVETTGVSANRSLNILSTSPDALVDFIIVNKYKEIARIRYKEKLESEWNVAPLPWPTFPANAEGVQINGIYNSLTYDFELEIKGSTEIVEYPNLKIEKGLSGIRVITDPANPLGYSLTELYSAYNITFKNNSGKTISKISFTDTTNTDEIIIPQGIAPGATFTNTMSYGTYNFTFFEMAAPGMPEMPVSYCNNIFINKDMNVIIPKAPTITIINNYQKIESIKTNSTFRPEWMLFPLTFTPGYENGLEKDRSLLIDMLPANDTYGFQFFIEGSALPPLERTGVLLTDTDIKIIINSNGTITVQ